jgi:DNA ligase D-like protein (predicted 3'-phosphoesterase)
MLAPKNRKKVISTTHRFYIHKHDATHLHYDLRLEIGGALASWAVPKGPSTDPAEKRYAARVPDHAIEYGPFEGVIPEGHYGAGPVMLWDRGTFENITKIDGKAVTAEEALESGKITFMLHGEKLKGLYALIRMSAKKNWLLIKVHDEYAHKPKHPLKLSRSVLTGRTMQQILAFGKEYFE